MRPIQLLIPAGLLAAAVLAPGPTAAPAPEDARRPLLTTGITGRAEGTGLDDPQYVLSLLPVQRLILAATGGPVAGSVVEKHLAGTPVTGEALVRLGLLSKEGESYRLAYSVLTVEDQERIYAAAREFGRDLADRFIARKPELDRLLARYPREELRDELAFGLVAGVVLNWEGLRQSTRLNLRIDPGSLPGKRPFLVHSEELGADTPTEGLYWGSHTFPGPEISFTTFGDGPSIPRMKGLPDALSEPVERGLAVLDGIPALRGAAQAIMVSDLVETLVDAGAILEALEGSGLDEAGLRERLEMAPERLSAILSLLAAVDYVAVADGRYVPAVPMLAASDRELFDGVVGLGSEIVVEWLQANRDALRSRLKELTPLRNGLPFEVVFNEVWHYTFGWTTRFLAEGGFYRNPRDPGYGRRGFVPLVWASSLYAGSD